MGEVVILVDGVYIHDDNNYVVNGLKPWAMDKSKKQNKNLENELQKLMEIMKFMVIICCFH